MKKLVSAIFLAARMLKSFTFMFKKEESEEIEIFGVVYYKNTTIPVSGVLLTIDGKTATTGIDGKYSITGIREGVQALSATKDGFDICSVSLTIHIGYNNYDIEMTSDQYTHNLKGIVTSLNLLEGSGPLDYCEVVVINPDGTDSNLKSHTSSNGYYQIPKVPQGNRTVRFKEINHETIELNIIMANSDYELNVNIQFIYIGRRFGGGKIAYVLQPNDPGFVQGQIKGLIAAPRDMGVSFGLGISYRIMGDAEWGCHGKSIGGTGTAVGTGASNTAKIIAGCSQPGIAARLCDELEINGYNDWYLPSKDELNKLYLNQYELRSHTDDDDCFGFVSYWSSSEYDSGSAWVQDFGNGDQLWRRSKHPSTARVRAVRAF